MQQATIKRIGILRGGAGKHYASSIKKGGEIISHIFEKLGEKYKVIDILIDKDYIWHANGVPINTSDLKNKVDLVWNASHPSFLNILGSLGIPSIGNKDFLPEQIKKFRIQIPRRIVSPKTAGEVFRKFGSPWIVKNSNEIRIVKTFNELSKIVSSSDDLVVEEFITGKVVSVHSVRKFRNEEFYVFPLVGSFGSFSSEEKEKIFTLAKDLHMCVNGGHYLKLVFVLTSKGKVYLLQIDGIPNLNLDSHFSQVCESVGSKPHHVVEHILEQVL